jgi:high-affinity iron transporter
MIHEITLNNTKRHQCIDQRSNSVQRLGANFSRLVYFGVTSLAAARSNSDIDNHFQFRDTGSGWWGCRPFLSMLQSFIIVLREGFESFLLVAVIVSYLRRSGQRQLASAVYAAIVAALGLSAGLGYLLFQMQTGNSDAVEKYFGSGVARFLGNEALREAVLGTIAIVMVASLVVYMWRTGSQLKQKMEQRLGEVSLRSGWAAYLGIFLFTALTISREGMETALMLLQVRTPRLIWGALIGLAAAGSMAWAWARFAHLINVKRFFQVTGIFLLLFMAQVAIYTFHEFAEAGVLPNSEALHAATEKFSPEGLYGQWFSVVMVAVCAVWLLGSWVADRLRQAPISNLARVEGAPPSLHS